MSQSRNAAAAREDEGGGGTAIHLEQLGVEVKVKLSEVGEGQEGIGVDELQLAGLQVQRGDRGAVEGLEDVLSEGLQWVALETEVNQVRQNRCAAVPLKL